MDPITLFAMANAAVSAVKKGCQLYKDIKGAAGDVKGVLKDLDDQFHKLHPPEKPPTVAQKNAYIEEKNRVIELNKQQGETAGIYQELANYLGDFFDNMNKCMAVIEEEERKAREEIYEGDSSLGRRALQLVIMKKQLEQMKVELREMMVYQAPPELGALWTDVSEMMNTMGKQQKVLIARQMQKQADQEARRAARMRQLTQDAWIGIIILFAIFVVAGMFMYVAYDRQRKYPQYGNEIFPKTERQRKEEAEPQVYIGR